jgi:predicted RNA-binding Zn-ribbon protein involved in translation (DUF1610 family)
MSPKTPTEEPTFTTPGEIVKPNWEPSPMPCIKCGGTLWRHECHGRTPRIRYACNRCGHTEHTDRIAAPKAPKQKPGRKQKPAA